MFAPSNFFFFWFVIRFAWIFYQLLFLKKQSKKDCFWAINGNKEGRDTCFSKLNRLCSISEIIFSCSNQHIRSTSNTLCSNISLKTKSSSSFVLLLNKSKKNFKKLFCLLFSWIQSFFCFFTDWYQKNSPWFPFSGFDNFVFASVKMLPKRTKKLVDFHFFYEKKKVFIDLVGI